MIKLDRQSLISLIVIVLILSLGTYLLYVFGFVDLLTNKQRLLVFIQQHRNTAAMTFIGLQVVQVLAAPVPGEVTGFVGGVFFGMGWGILYSTIGLAIGSWLAFLLARLLGRHIIEMVVKRETIERYDYVMKHKGLAIAFIMFLIPGFPKDLLCYVLGLGHMGQRDFLLISTTGRLLGTTLLTVGGTFFRDARYGALFTIAGVSIGLILVGMIFRDNIERWFRMLRAEERRAARSARKKKRQEEKD
jgi:uncharacterized membrane protein YdjX (TVP38/TMEM64 family)